MKKRDAIERKVIELLCELIAMKQLKLFEQNWCSATKWDKTFILYDSSNKICINCMFLMKQNQ